MVVRRTNFIAPRVIYVSSIRIRFVGSKVHRFMDFLYYRYHHIVMLSEVEASLRYSLAAIC